MYCKTPVTKDHTMYCKTPVTKDYTMYYKKSYKKNQYNPTQNINSFYPILTQLGMSVSDAVLLSYAIDLTIDCNRSNIIRKGYAEWIHEIGLSLLEFRQSIQNLISLGYVIQTDVGQHAVNYDQLLSDLGLFYSDNKEVK